ncbi:serine--tRNA ligase, partial [Patescibacteria group bacterium]|nr:serine--tRNA ligase [Patescibacteria group bacterium]
MKDINKKIEEINPKLISLEMEVKELLFKVPNLTHKDVIRSMNEDDNPVLQIVGEPTKFDFKPKDHVELAEQLDLIDLERGAKVAGNKFYYLKNELALMELALMQYALDTVVKHGFTSFITPDLAKKDILESLGFNPRGESAQIYNIENSDLSLIGTAEITMGGYHANEIIDEDKLPLRYVAFSHCFRTEAGAYSKFSKGIFRVHQFSKVEMFAYTVPEDG